MQVHKKSEHWGDGNGPKKNDLVTTAPQPSSNFPIEDKKKTNAPILAVKGEKNLKTHWSALSIDRPQTEKTGTRSGEAFDGI